MTLRRMGAVLSFRITLILSVVLMVGLVFLTLTAVQMSDQLKVVAQFFPTTKDSSSLYEFNQLNTLSPIEMGDRRLVDEMLMRYYLQMRYEQIPDAREMSYRWGVPGPVYILSDYKIYNEFAVGLEKKLEDLPDQITTINIKDVSRHDNVFMVNFSVLEQLPNGQVRIREKNAVLEFRYGRGRPRWDPKLINPYGLIFNRFEETERKPVSQ